MKTKKSSMSVGFSAAASWAWGTSLIMGQQIVQEKGLIAWLIWAGCNSATLALFGWLHNKGIIDPKAYRRKGMKIIALIIQLFCLLVQLNFINQQFMKITSNPILSYIITIVIGFIFTLIVFKKGLPTSIKTDVWQWLGAIGTILVVIAVGIITKVPFAERTSTTGSSVMWGIWSGLILFAGPIGDMQHWQRAEADDTHTAYYKSAFAFAGYMLLILGMGCFQFSPLMNALLLIPVLCVTTSTIDSIAVALHELGNKKIGTGIALAMCVLWGLFVEMGMIEMWSSFGVIRFAFAIAVLLLPLCLKHKKGIVIPLVILTYAAMILFAVFGQITINSIFGIVSFAIATGIMIYLIVMSLKK